METGSEALAEELAFLEEGSKGVPPAPLPVAGFFAFDYEWHHPPAKLTTH